MNDTDVRDLFGAAVARPDADRIDTDEVLRGGRRRQRIRTGATAGSALAVLAVVASLVVSGSRGDGVVADPSPSASATAPAPSTTTPVAASPALVTNIAQVAGTWYAVRLGADDVTGYQVQEGKPLAVRFGAQRMDDFWELNGSCNQEGGRYAVDASGRWTARYTGSITFVACRPLQDVRVQDAIDALTGATSATLERDARQGSVLTLRGDGGAVLAVWSSRTSAPVDVVAPPCKEAVLTPGGSIADQETVDAVADRVRAEAAAAQPTDNLSVLVVHPDRLAVDVFWVGVVPTFLTDLVAQQAQQGVTVTVIPARFTRAQMLAAGEKALRVGPPAGDPASQGLVIGSASGCNDGSGIKVELAKDSTSEPAPTVPPAYAAAIRAAVGDMPVLIVPGWRPIPAVAEQR